jgi:hypothetical protein
LRPEVSSGPQCSKRTKKTSKKFRRNPKVPKTPAVTPTRSAVKGLEKIFSKNPKVLAKRSVKGVERAAKD